MLGIESRFGLGCITRLRTAAGEASLIVAVSNERCWAPAGIAAATMAITATDSAAANRPVAHGCCFISTLRRCGLFELGDEVAGARDVAPVLRCVGRQPQILAELRRRLVELSLHPEQLAEVVAGVVV